jgi:hypothetical protein
MFSAWMFAIVDAIGEEVFVIVLKFCRLVIQQL